jgi:hypothetical protein
MMTPQNIITGLFYILSLVTAAIQIMKGGTL